MLTVKPKGIARSKGAKTNPFFYSKKDGESFFGQREQQRSFFPSGYAMDKNSVLQAKLTIGQSNDKYEREADAMANKVIQRLALSAVQRKCTQCEDEENKNILQKKRSTWEKTQESRRQSEPSLSSVRYPNVESRLNTMKGRGDPLPATTRKQMENSFGMDFSGVRLHTDNHAAQMNKELHAQAFTHGSDIYFGSGKYDTNSTGGQHLLAHELTHVVQQTHIGNQLQRVVELRPPGPGEASAFNRVGQLIDRINEQSDRVRYFLRGNRLAYEDIPADEIILNPFGVRSPNFDRKMKAYIDREEVVPMRLITSAGFVGGGPLLVDSLQEAYVDLDDLLGRDDLSFQLNLIHMLTERFGVRDYERRIGTNMPEFNRVHRAGLEDEAAHLQSVIGDPTIRFNYEETRPNGSLVFAFRSAEGYRIFHVFRGAGRAERTGEIFVRMPDGRRLTVEALRSARRAAGQR